MQGKRVKVRARRPDATDWCAAIDAWDALRRYPKRAQYFALQRIAAMLAAQTETGRREHS